MGFESGSVSFRFFHLPRPLPEDAVDRFAEHALRGIEHVGEEEVRGWVTGRHLLDRHITSGSALFGSYLRLCLTRAERKIPRALLQAECTVEELAQLAASGRDYLNRKEKREIKLQVIERLLPSMPPTLTGIPMIHDFTKPWLVAGALNEKQTEALAIHFRHTLGYEFAVEDASLLALIRKKVNVGEWRTVSFSPEIEDAYADEGPGQDFLTWLWFDTETRKGRFKSSEGELDVMIEGPLTFVYEGQGAHETVLRKGEPVNSAEAKTCLLSGKKLKAAQITLAVDEDHIWRFAFDAESWAFRGVKLPDSDAPDAITRFQDRMVSIDSLRGMFSELYDAFVDVRKDAARWKAEQKRIFEWVRNRSERR